MNVHKENFSLYAMHKSHFTAIAEHQSIETLLKVDTLASLTDREPYNIDTVFSRYPNGRESKELLTLLTLAPFFHPLHP